MAWIGDGSNATESDGPTITCKVAAQDDKEESDNEKWYSALWVDGEGVFSGEHYWTITIEQLEDFVFVGFSNMERLKQPYGFRGLMFSCNLSDGDEALSLSFYEEHIGLQSGDKVGLLANFDYKLKIYIYVNDVPLGIAFDVPRESLLPIFPAISFDGLGKATIRKESDIPTVRERFIPVYSGLEGNWKLDHEKSQLGGKNVPFPEYERLITIQLRKKGENTFDAHMKVVHFINFQLKYENGKWNTLQSTTLGSWPDHRLRADEKELFNVMKCVEVLEETSDVLKASKGSDVFYWSRYDILPEIVTCNPFE